MKIGDNYYHDEVSKYINSDLDIMVRDSVKIILRDNDEINKKSVDISIIYEDIRRRIRLLLMSNITNDEKRKIQEDLDLSLKILEFRFIEHFSIKANLLNDWRKEHPEKTINKNDNYNQNNLTEEEMKFLLT
jgi:hypothetical protein